MKQPSILFGLSMMVLGLILYVGYQWWATGFASALIGLIGVAITALLTGVVIALFTRAKEGWLAMWPLIFTILLFAFLVSSILEPMITPLLPF